MLLALVPLVAAASSPDPAWIGGISDAADGDEIMALIADQAGSDGVAAYALGKPIELPQALLQPEHYAAQGFSSLRSPRGPPPRPCTSITTPPLLPARPLRRFTSARLHSSGADCAEGEKRMTWLQTIQAAADRVTTPACPDGPTAVRR
jgi:hypothetical protein